MQPSVATVEVKCVFVESCDHVSLCMKFIENININRSCPR